MTSYLNFQKMKWTANINRNQMIEQPKKRNMFELNNILRRDCELGVNLNLYIIDHGIHTVFWQRTAKEIEGRNVSKFIEEGLVGFVNNHVSN